ncbi:TauD/TfdA dioxygenase family protein [Bordetella hinzii]|uniref:Taurine dioxygenase n=2 Tax=Bordetella hinzii TaxID=103855 RepID=A0AAN1S0C1_9BORD|nr:TauD/TfdA family dioxygenase [Bordetella hinzii]AKQ55693.1 Alpha-ketoglutarate-dependent taurine dioxygenase [Bordetella hinzii]AKQ60196.1 Alpha-ketoglutarate-dependent taurine dioxygenase [Bordetella hinzii]AZW18728.1 taurine dioxygenase [Bordetella hinzii]KCB24539.1 taurine catabolism dioxygenase, TauD/TfdA family [Bordetella hinzii OH87 BAL007II]KCB31223.1 taurine catabolism dioxygenase, TauD/TfdA family [Bordetella hinzii L60]
MRIEPKNAALGATIHDIDLSQPLDEASFRAIEQALGRYGVLSFPRQTWTTAQQRAFAQRFGQLEINVANTSQDNEFPDVMILSNMVENGKPLGLNDAGQDWHTDMSYSRTIAFSNVLYGIRIPMRDGQPLGNTEFCNMHAAYEDLPQALKDELDGMTITHDFNKFWEKMRSQPGSRRAPLTEEQRRRKPPVSHPVFLRHPITGRKVLYANPGYSVRINELPEARSEEVLAFLFEHQLQDKYRYQHRWAEGDVLMWDNMGTIHNAVADYRPDEPRYIRRCQVMADRYFPELY